jgi:hypothetical protein
MAGRLTRSDGRYPADHRPASDASRPLIGVFLPAQNLCGADFSDSEAL